MTRVVSAEFGFKPRGADGPRGAGVRADSDPASPKRPPRAFASRQSSAAAAAAEDFEIRENARLALEMKQEELTKLRARLSATEDALRRRAERNAELETRLSEHEGSKVAAEAEALNSSLAAAMRDVRGFFSAGGKVDAAKTRSSGNTSLVNGGDDRDDETDATFGDASGGGALRSGLKKKAPKSARDVGQTASRVRGVTFVAESEQKRLEEEGDYVAKLRVKTAENEELVARLLASATSLERKREQMRVAKASYLALQKRLEEETRRREDAERRTRGGRNGSTLNVNETFATRESTAEESVARLLRDVLGVTAHACGVSGRADSRAVTSALPALASLARDGPGETALELLTETRVLEHTTRVFELHEDDADVCASVAQTLAALVAGARAANAATPRGAPVEAVERSLASSSLASLASRALAKHRSSPEACASACDLIHALCHAFDRGDRDAASIGGASAKRAVSERVSELTRLGCAASLVDAAEWHPSDEDVAASAARAIVSMVQHGTARDARTIAQCGAAAVVRRAERYGLETGLRHAGREVESWVRDGAGADVEADDGKKAATPRRRAAIPEETAYDGSGLKPPHAGVSQSRQSGGISDAFYGDAFYGDGDDFRGGDGANRRDAAEDSEDDFDDAQFDDKL